MPDKPAVVGEVSGGTEEYTREMHQFAKGKIGDQDTDDKEVDIEEHPDPAQYLRVGGEP